MAFTYQRRDILDRENILSLILRLTSCTTNKILPCQLKLHIIFNSHLTKTEWWNLERPFYKNRGTVLLFLLKQHLSLVLSANVQWLLFIHVANSFVNKLIPFLLLLPFVIKIWLKAFQLCKTCRYPVLILSRLLSFKTQKVTIFSCF